ncbi:hypothetical protein TC41_2181 [Alicyclobacillus acidocaldarius subsp. acidocaldarius Tc-4-1]|uniref:Uncharacterized protein n=1 Tax=Alicyclobacillus acidocaldarius (strain Tc-4-1) TaxID=1048834 RepID=F8IFC2_ALIAT|nr:hypothetical protein TC41_2181 [Alicyclobacillus acidocaldarius subsp. acidocaldarius Tc-4-1]
MRRRGAKARCGSPREPRRGLELAGTSLRGAERCLLRSSAPPRASVRMKTLTRSGGTTAPRALVEEE